MRSFSFVVNKTSWFLLLVVIISLGVMQPGFMPVAPLHAQSSGEANALNALNATATRALLLNGVDAYVAVPDDPMLTPTTGATYEAWVYPTNLNGCRAIFGKDYTQGYWVGLCGGRIRFHSGGNASVAEGTTVLPINVWTHIALVWDPAAEKRIYYINGDIEYIGPAGTTPTGNRELRIGNDYPWDFFAGYIAEARLWHVARTQDDIRHTMHRYLDEKIPGLVAAWHLIDTPNDAIGGRVGTTHGTNLGYALTPGDALHPFPLHFATVPANDAFNTLPNSRYGAGLAFIPQANLGLLIGGNVDGNPSNRVDRLDAGTGDVTPLATLPVNLFQPAVAYAPDTDTVYVFGGTANNQAQAAIYAINPHTGAVRTLATPLAVAASAPTGVYHAGLHKIFVFGGVGSAANSPAALDQITIFDPVTEQLTPATFHLPIGVAQAAASYAPATDSIFLFGGADAQNQALANIIEVRAGANGAPGSATLLATRLPKADYGLSAVVDGKAQLVYLLGGFTTERVLVFDPTTNQLWATPNKLPATRQWASALYSDRNRHALVVGGFNQTGQNSVWQVKLGDGPAVELGRWDFDFLGYNVNDIDGNAQRVVFGLNGNAFMRRADGQGSFYGSATLGGSNVRIVRYDPSTDRTYFVMDTNTIMYDTGNTLNKLWPPPTGGSALRVLDFNPLGYSPLIATAVDNNVPQGHPTLIWRSGINGNSAWQYNWSGCHDAHSLVKRTMNQTWGLVSYATCGPKLVNAQPQAVAGDVVLKGLTYNILTGQSSELNYGAICNAAGFQTDFLTKMLFGPNGDLWVSGIGGVCRYPAASLPDTPGGNGGFTILNTPTGARTTDASVDGDGRVWFGVNSAANQSGGLTVFEVKGKTPDRQSLWTTDYTWLNAPIGSHTVQGNNWDSSIAVIKAVDERVWGARGAQIFTVAQRWQQLDESASLRAQKIRHLWTVRGRLFVATDAGLSLLQPDGSTWENLPLPGVQAVMGDAQGRIWIGSSAGVQLYTPTGLLAVPSPTPAPAGAVTALRRDGQGRIWIGGAAGLTLYDRNRFVTTLTPPTGGTITALLTDHNDTLWVGTTAGLARFALADATWRTFTTANGLPNNEIADMALLPNGWLAISHATGVVQYRGENTFVPYSVSGKNLPLSVDEHGRLWVGSFYVDGDGWQDFFPTNSGLRTSTVIANAADGTDRVWFAHPDGGISVRGATLPPLAESVPLISGINPKSGSVNDTIHILGSGFGLDRSVLEVTIGGDSVEILAVTDNDITVRIAATTVSGTVSVTKNRKRTTTSGGALAFCAIPKITGVTPSGGNAGVMVSVTGTNFDPVATLGLGGAAREASVINPTRLTTIIQESDGTGSVRVTNRCGDVGTWGIPFNTIHLTIDRLVLSQGLPDQPLLYGRPTLLQNFLLADQEKRATDAVEVDRVNISFTDPRNGAFVPISRPYEQKAVPVHLQISSPPPPALLKYIGNSLNIADVLPVGGAGFESGDLQVRVALLRRGQTVATSMQNVHFERNIHLRVILVPVMKRGYTPIELETIKRNTDSHLDHLRRRLMPTGDVELIWSDDVLAPDETFSLDDFAKLYHFAPQLDRARSRWNSRTNADALIAFGVVDPRLVTGTATGYGFWPDASTMINTLALDWLDTLCDVGNTVVHTVSFGMLGSDDGCHLEIPLYIGWAVGDNGTAKYVNGVRENEQSSALFAHEFGHIMNLVKPWAVNGSLHDNFTHSINDEIGPRGTLTQAGKSCAAWKQGRFDWGLTLYAQPGVRDPIINPIAGEQFEPDHSPDPLKQRAKAIMSYACAKTNENVFYEPVDVASLRAVIGGTDLSGFINSLKPLAAQAAAPMANHPLTQRAIAGERLHVAGIVQHSTVAQPAETGVIERVEALDEAASLSLAFNTGYWLVQRDAQGNELARFGIFPAFDLVHKHEVAESPSESPVGFFAATMLKAAGVAKVELRHHDTLLATFAAGNAPPSVSLSSPVGGNFVDGSIPVSWTATDPDGDAQLEISVDYSADGGATWRPIASGTGSGNLTVPVSQLAGSNNARLRISASDGLHTANIVSLPFSVAAQQPHAFIASPVDGATFTEGSPIALIGQARDNQDGDVAASSLHWFSDRDGDLGTGQQLHVQLSVGVHRLTLAAQNRFGLSDSVTTTVTVVGDYDGDSLPDSVESATQLNPLTANDAYSDADQDGLPLVMEQAWGTNPNNADSDGDGRPDNVEVSEGTDATAADATLPPDQLTVTPESLQFTADLALDTLLPQQIVQIVSRSPVTWTLTTNVDWLAFSAAKGQTPAAPTILVKPATLNNGVYTAILTFASATLGRVQVPVTVTVTNKAGYCDTNRDGSVNQNDIQEVIQHVGMNTTQADFDFHDDLDRDGDVDAQDLALVQACLNAPPPSPSSQRVYLPLVQR